MAFVSEKKVNEILSQINVILERHGERLTALEEQSKPAPKRTTKEANDDK